jgi:hypothetical protein
VRSGNKLLKIAAVVLASLFIVVAAAAFYIYNRVADAAKGLEAIGTYTPPASGYSPENRSIPAPVPSMFGVAPSSGSGLGLISGSIPDETPQQAITPQDAQNMVGAFSKYVDRPVVKELIADLKKDPEMAKALAMQKEGNNPLAMIAAVQRSGSGKLILSKYAMRPDFIKVMMEMMADPALRPMMKAIPGGVPQPPQAIPQQAPTPAPAEAAPRQDEPQADDSAPMMLDTSQISGTPSDQPDKAVRHEAPPPVDN